MLHPLMQPLPRQRFRKPSPVRTSGHFPSPRFPIPGTNAESHRRKIAFGYLGLFPTRVLGNERPGLSSEGVGEPWEGAEERAARGCHRADALPQAPGRHLANSFPGLFLHLKYWVTEAPPTVDKIFQ